MVGAPLDRLVGLDLDGRRKQSREIDDTIGRWSAARSPEAATEELQTHAVPSHPVATADDVWHDPQLAHRGHYVELPHPTLGTTWVVGSRFEMSRSAVDLHRAGGRIGEDTYEILTDVLGYPPDRIAELAETGVLE